MRSGTRTGTTRGAATAIEFGGRPAPRRTKIRSFRSWRNAAGTVLGYISAELPSGLGVNNLKLMIGPEGKRWIAMPSGRQVDRDGNPRLDVNGKQLWSPTIEFANRKVADAFRDVILDALREQHPEALGGDQP
jgi:hypothetical protein